MPGRLIAVIVCGVVMSTACAKRPAASKTDKATTRVTTQSAPARQTDEELVATVKSIVAKQLSKDPNAIDVKVPLSKLGADELDIVEIVLEVETQLNITIKDEEIGDGDSFKTLSTENLIDIVKKKKFVAILRTEVERS